MKRLGSDSVTVTKPNVLIVDHMYGKRQEQWQTLRAVARHASQVVKSTKVQLTISCVWRAASFYSSQHSQKVSMAQFSLYVHKGALKLMLGRKRKRGGRSLGDRKQ